MIMRGFLDLGGHNRPQSGIPETARRAPWHHAFNCLGIGVQRTRAVPPRRYAMLDLDLMLKRNELCVVGMDPARDAQVRGRSWA